MDIKVDNQVTVVFDLDDTLYYEIDYLISVYKELAFKLDCDNYKHLFSVLFSMYRNDQDVFEFIEDEFGVNKEDLINFYREHKPSITLNSGVLDVFESIKKKSGNIAVITDGRKITQQNKIEALGITKYLDFVSISQVIGYEKPSLIPFQNIMDKFDSKTYYYIADNFKKDFIAPNKLNWKSIGIIDSGKNIHSNAFRYIDSFYQPKNVVFSFLEINVL